MTDFGEFVNKNKDYVVCIPVWDTFWLPSNKIHRENGLCPCGDKKRLKLSWLLLKDLSISLTNQAGTTASVHLVEHSGPQVFVADCIVEFISSQMTSKGVIMVFLQDFHPKKLNLGYL